MQYYSTTATASRHKTECAIVGIFAPRKLGPAASKLDKASNGALSSLLKSGDAPVELGRTLLVNGLPGVAARRVLLVGLGKASEFTFNKYRRASAAAYAVLGRGGSHSATNYLNSDAFTDRKAYQAARHGVAALADSLYKFNELKSDKKKPAPRLKRIGFAARGRGGAAAIDEATRDGDAIAAGTALAKDLGNRPANVCTPAHLAKHAREIARRYAKVTTKVLSETEIKKLRMGAFLSVTAGAEEPARMIVMEYRGAARSNKPVALVGKGITFDTGGISIKPASAMDEMKYDMCGAASVLGTFLAVAKLKLPINLVGIIPACENMPGGRATRPGDIVKTMSGKTVEILNTDAEGRLILCDALTYAQRFKPAAIVDIATLTGACVIALGEHCSGLMTPDDGLAKSLVKAGEQAGDVAWRLPVMEEYFTSLKSNFADFANVGGRPGGAVTAACFLWQFVKDARWAHLDIAGTAWKGGNAKGATGRPVPLLVQYLIDQS